MARVSPLRSSEQSEVKESHLSLVEKAEKGYTNLGPEHFLHGRKGPWPQPSPAHPIGEASAVIHLPVSEVIDWWTFIGLRYLTTTAFYTPVAFAKSFFKPGLKNPTTIL